jgi:hypothetical protein
MVEETIWVWSKGCNVMGWPLCVNFRDQRLSVGIWESMTNEKLRVTCWAHESEVGEIWCLETHRIKCIMLTANTRVCNLWCLSWLLHIFNFEFAKPCFINVLNLLWRKYVSPLFLVRPNAILALGPALGSHFT